MRPYRVQWQNTVQARKPWVDFYPPLIVLAYDEAGAVSFAISQRLSLRFSADPMRAVEISWEEYTRAVESSWEK